MSEIKEENAKFSVDEIDPKRKKGTRPLLSTPCGEETAFRLRKVFDKDTNEWRLEKYDFYNLQEEIEANSNLADTTLLKARYHELHEVPDLPPNGINGIDTGKMPKNIHELYKIINGASDAYNNLSDDLKKAFGSKDGYIDAIVSGRSADILKKVVKNRLKNQPKKEENE